MSDLEKWLIKQQETIDEMTREIKAIKKLQEKYPDLSCSIDRWDNLRLTSSEVNNKATHVDFRHSCGCCDDAPLLAMPYVVEAGGRQVFSNPERFFVGEKNPYHYGRDKEEIGWEKELLNAQIPQTIIDKIRAYFDEWDEDDEEYDYNDED